MECYNVYSRIEDDDPLDINIPESEGMCVVEGAPIYTNNFLIHSIMKINIGSFENPKLGNIEDYWDKRLWEDHDLLHYFMNFPQVLTFLSSRKN